MRVERMDGGFIVRIPEDVVHELQLRDGDGVTLLRSDPSYAEVLDRVAKMTREEAVEGLRSMRFNLPADYKFDRDEANAR